MSDNNDAENTIDSSSDSLLHLLVRYTIQFDRRSRNGFIFGRSNVDFYDSAKVDIVDFSERLQSRICARRGDKKFRVANDINISTAVNQKGYFFLPFLKCFDFGQFLLDVICGWIIGIVLV